MDIWSIGSSEVNKTLEEKVDKLINATQYGEFAEILKNSTGVLVAVANISHTISSSGSHSNSVLQCVPQVFEQGIVILDHVSHLQVDCVPGKVSEDALAQLRQILTDIAPSLVPSALTIQSMNLALLPSCRQKLISHVSDIEGIFKYIPPLLENFHNAFIVCQGQSKFIASEFTRVSALLFDVLGQLQSKAPLFSTTDLHLKTLFSVLHVPFQTCLISLRLLFSLPLLETKFETVFKACAHAKEIYILATNILKTLYLLFLRNIHEPVKDDLIKSIQNAQDVCKGSPFKSCLTFNLNDKPTIYPKSTADAPNMQCASNKLAVKKTKKKTTALEHSYAKADAPNMQCVSNKPAVKKTKKKTEKRIVSSPMKKKRDLVKQISLTELKKYQAGGMSMSLRNDVKINENGSVGNMKDHGPGFESNTISNRFESSTIQTEISDVKIIGPVCNPEALCSADPDDLIKSIQNAQDVCKGSPFKSCLTFNLNDKSTIYPKSTADAPNMQCASNKLAVKKTKKKTTALEHSYAKADAPNMQCVSNKPAVKKTKTKTEKRIVSSPMKKKRDLVKQISLTELKKYQAGGMSMSLRNDVKINENGS
ncbi:uncharacterized protein [Bemisia tabaci]|uniref:uncharacterized protein n=1 Tax=Bemisia tabaci TaxID=7038 RepID=UPI003B28B0CB